MTQPPNPDLPAAPENEERWKKICAQVATENDPAKFVALLEELNHLLEAREQRLRDLRSKSRLEVNPHNAPPKSLP